MKARMTIIWEKEIPEEDFNWLTESAVEDGDIATLLEYFGDSPDEYFIYELPTKKGD